MSLDEASLSSFQTSQPGIPRYVDSVYPHRDISADVNALKDYIWAGAFLALFAIALGIIENELCFRNNFSASLATESLRWILLGMNMMHWAAIYKYYKCRTSIAEAYGIIYPGSTCYAGSIFSPKHHTRGIIIDLLSVSFSPPPNVYMSWELSQLKTTASMSLDDIMLILELLRLIQLLKLFYLASALFKARDTFIL